ncbi:MAG TPA: nuclear transport factor 2 family protein [Pyrinomonadaceae bacterium]
MRRFLITAALCLCAAPAAAQQPTTPAQTPAQPATQKPAGEKVGMAGAEQAVAGRVSAFLAALRKGDEATLAPFYADDYTITMDTGAVQTKAERLAWVKANTARLSTLDFQDLKTRVYGDTAVVTGHAIGQGEGDAKVNSRMIQVWVKQGGEWRLVGGQTTAIAPAQPATAPAEKKP